MRRTVPLLLAVTLTVVGLGVPTTAQAAPTTGLRFADIAVGNGVVLKANVIEPATAGRHPAVVFPSSWGLNDLEYLAQARKLAEGGYTVLSYTPRGWWASGGEIDTAGPKDIADVSRVLDWLVANTSADPARIGMSGVSYGAGISLIASGHDSRVKAVAALSGWTDLVSSLYGGDTRRVQSSALLVLAAALLGNTSAEFDGIIEDFYAYRNIEGVKNFARIRSAATYLAGINANRPAILIANGYGDSIFPPNQIIDFYGALAGPKRIELAPGDHAIPELTGLIGLPNGAWNSVRRWLDRYLMGISNGIDTEPGIVLKSLTGGPTQAYHTLPATSTRLGLGEVSFWTGTGALGGAPTTGWSRSAEINPDTAAHAGVVLLTNGLQALTGPIASAWIPGVSRVNAGVWIASSDAALAIRGMPSLRLRVRPERAEGTLVAYLYDMDRLGNGKLISHAPVSWRGGAGVTRDIDLRLPAVSWDVPAGHKLALVVDGSDGFYLDDNTAFASATFTGPSWLDISS